MPRHGGVFHQIAVRLVARVDEKSRRSCGIVGFQLTDLSAVGKLIYVRLSSSGSQVCF